MEKVFDLEIFFEGYTENKAAIRVIDFDKVLEGNNRFQTAIPGVADFDTALFWKLQRVDGRLVFQYYTRIQVSNQKLNVDPTKLLADIFRTAVNRKIADIPDLVINPDTVKAQVLINKEVVR